jgi:methionine synthase II (cobalamin-independent)
MAFRYHADHVGSLLRPQELLDARRNPQVTREQLTAIEDRHILDVLRRQKDAGLEIFTDGELRRTGFMSDFYESVDGLERALESLAVSPQCGFASTMEGNLLSEEDQWRKLQLVVDTARRVWTDA